MGSRICSSPCIKSKDDAFTLSIMSLNNIPRSCTSVKYGEDNVLELRLRSRSDGVDEGAGYESRIASLKSTR